MHHAEARVPNAPFLNHSCLPRDRILEASVPGALQNHTECLSSGDLGL